MDKPKHTISTTFAMSLLQAELIKHIALAKESAAMLQQLQVHIEQLEGHIASADSALKQSATAHQVPVVIESRHELAGYLNASYDAA